MSQKFPQYANALDAFHERWIETILGPIDGTHEIVKQLQNKDIPLYAITNFSAEKWPILCAKYEMPAVSFIDVVVSGEEKIVKPDPAIYQILFDRNNLNAADCIFIDDSAANIKAANEIGMDAILFQNPDQLKDDLTARQIL